MDQYACVVMQRRRLAFICVTVRICRGVRDLTACETLIARLNSPHHATAPTPAPALIVFEQPLLQWLLQRNRSARRPHSRPDADDADWNTAP